MYCDMSLARVGLDFRGLLPPIFEACVLNMFAKVRWMHMWQANRTAGNLPWQGKAKSALGLGACCGWLERL